MSTKLIFILGFTILFLQSCSSTRNSSISEWEKHEWSIVKIDKKEVPRWKIYKRNLKGTNFLEYKIEGNIKSSPEACLKAFKKDIHKLANGAENKKYPIYEISEESENSLLTYVVHNEPFPFKNTEMSVRYLFYNDDVGNFDVEWNEEWEESQIKPSKKLNRVETFRGAWSFSLITNNSSKAINSVQFDPKGMPLWLINPMVYRFLKEGLENIRTTSKQI
ncbi:hypothetical protein [Polaribacter sp. Hel1_85]|uniref:hypothetical protein n=1 Tax=Polaribacter sp. Hel1_85 TaxID=1250005 RepID=UPI00052B9CEA|nr:hypothetical protein [Polaribacter sp. Hel1_85]KGL61716.1 hypothetical protein PHEL85_1497 [Polaribacter sp. Hel1_85]